MKFDRLELTVAPSGKLMRRFDAEHAGAYSRQRQSGGLEALTAFTSELLRSSLGTHEIA